MHLQFFNYLLLLLALSVTASAQDDISPLQLNGYYNNESFKQRDAINANQLNEDRKAHHDVALAPLPSDLYVCEPVLFFTNDILMILTYRSNTINIAQLFDHDTSVYKKKDAAIAWGFLRNKGRCNKGGSLSPFLGVIKRQLYYSSVLQRHNKK